jgi:hypothetical protein
LPPVAPVPYRRQSFVANSSPLLATVLVGVVSPPTSENRKVGFGQQVRRRRSLSFLPSLPSLPTLHKHNNTPAHSPPPPPTTHTTRNNVPLSPEDLQGRSDQREGRQVRSRRQGPQEARRWTGSHQGAFESELSFHAARWGRSTSALLIPRDKRARRVTNTRRFRFFSIFPSFPSFCRHLCLFSASSSAGLDGSRPGYAYWSSPCSRCTLTSFRTVYYFCSLTDLRLALPQHEIVGEVVEVPASEKRWKVGDRVGSGTSSRPVIYSSVFSSSFFHRMARWTLLPLPLLPSRRLRHLPEPERERCLHGRWTCRVRDPQD